VEVDDVHESVEEEEEEHKDMLAVAKLYKMATANSSHCLTHNTNTGTLTSGF
jgi:hypothetical protein